MLTWIFAASSGFLGLLSLILGGFLLKSRIRQIELKEEIKRLLAQIQDRERDEVRIKAAAQIEFSRLAEQIIQNETRLFQEKSEKGLEHFLLPLLNPLKERLKDFEKRVEESYQAEGRERFVLKKEVERLITLNERIVNETRDLSSALKGDSKFQGDWGEMVLETILQSSGLREGIEYVKQSSHLSDEGDRYRPDLMVRLPDDKQIIIDSKVSLTAYERYCQLARTANESIELKRALDEHLASLERHVNELAEKHYPRLKGLKTPEFVFLFTPIEPSYLLAMRHDPELATRAWKKGVAIVTSTTLMTSLKTVASIWRLENQNRNASEIASEAARLYDKFVSFYEDFEKLGRLFESGSATFDEARRKLRDGPGNVFRKMEQLRDLGAAPSKRLRPELLE